MLTVFIALAAIAAQDPAPGIVNAPVERSEAQAQLDVCLYTPAQNRDPSCQPILEAEASLVPDQAFASARPTALGWADTACPTGRFSGAARTACRDEQRGLFRRAERAREALLQGAAGGVYAEAWDRPPAAASGASAPSGALSFHHEEQTSEGPCERRSTASRDDVAGTSSSSYSIGCSWTNGDGDSNAAREVLDALRDDDWR